MCLPIFLPSAAEITITRGKDSTAQRGNNQRLATLALHLGGGLLQGGSYRRTSSAAHGVAATFLSSRHAGP
jgi:hypothetical protein